MAGQIAAKDYIAICNLKSRYCRMIDTKNWDGVAALITDDFEMDMTETSPMPIIRGRQEAMAAISGSMQTLTTAHQLHIPEIEIEGDSAKVVFPMNDRVVWQGGGMTGYGYYHERYVRQSGTWKLAATKLTRLHVDMAAPPA